MSRSHQVGFLEKPYLKITSSFGNCKQMIKVLFFFSIFHAGEQLDFATATSLMLPVPFFFSSSEMAPSFAVSAICTACVVWLAAGSAQGRQRIPISKEKMSEQCYFIWYAVSCSFSASKYPNVAKHIRRLELDSFSIPRALPPPPPPLFSSYLKLKKRIKVNEDSNVFDWRECYILVIPSFTSPCPLKRR